jgi:hypothetical protein
VRFTAAGEDQHRGVHASGVGLSRALRTNRLDEEDSAGRRHGCAAVCQDSHGSFVVPIVDDPLQQIAIRASWHGFGEVAGDFLDTPGGVVPVDGAVGRLHYVGEVEEQTDRIRVGVQTAASSAPCPPPTSTMRR